MTHDPKTYRFFLMTVDPVHVGTGGTRLGRVDLSIVREPGTHLPKIPGTSLHGAIRAYSAYRYGKRRCAGQGQSGGHSEGHCGRPTCPICYTFGAITGQRSYSGVVAIGDARILLFPVYSMVGPVWVTSPSALQDAGLVTNRISVAMGKAKWGGTGSELPTDKPLNLGWLMVEREGDWPSDIRLPAEIPEPIRQHVILVSDALLSQIVNSNLEVRTSVAINPETGAAEEKALFTYEAIPRTTVLWMDVVMDDYRGEFPNKNQLEKWESILEKNDRDTKWLLKHWHLWKEDKNDESFGEKIQEAMKWVQDELNRYGNGIVWEDVMQVITAGLEWAEHLGVGGMGTRGFGRIRKLMDCPVETNGTLGSPCSNEDDSHGGTGITEESSP